jgi:flavin reductase
MVSSKTSEMTTPPLTALQFRKALGQFATGVSVITVEREPGAVHGMTANSFTSVSLDPMLILVCVDQSAIMLPLLHKKNRFGVSVLKEGQEALSRYFTRKDQNAEDERRLSIRYRTTPGGVPVLEGALLQLTCNVIASHPAGDHTIFVAEVMDAEIHEGDPLLFFRSGYHSLARNH